ncbi:hypothetical protein BJF90_31310 [Pseudonocardia sp. CNS-004]|nr:hypothetical protein BJF90_31310 [Pseudonocardia sp. CNS-004]
MLVGDQPETLLPQRFDRAGRGQPARRHEQVGAHPQRGERPPGRHQPQPRLVTREGGELGAPAHPRQGTRLPAPDRVGGVVEAVEHERVARGLPLVHPAGERGCLRHPRRAEELRERDAARVQLTGELDRAVERLGGVGSQTREGDDQV